jgi:hypothetical protein
MWFMRGTEYRATFASPAGQRVLADLMRFCLMNQDTHDPDPHQAAYNNGKRRVGLRIAFYLGFDEAQAMKFLEDSKPALAADGDPQ